MISAGGRVSTVGRIQEAPFFFFFLLCFFFNLVYSATNPNYTACFRQTCDGITVDYPFSLSSQCGYPGLTLLCLDNYQTLLLQTSTFNFTVIDIHYARGPIVVAIDPIYMMDTGKCRYPRKNITLDDIKLAPPLFFRNGALTTANFFYSCTTPVTDSSNGGYGGGDYDFSSQVVPSCVAGSRNSYAFLGNDSPGTVNMSCQSSVIFPVSASSAASNIISTLNDGFSMSWRIDAANPCYGCSASGGGCGSTSTGGFICFCRDDPHETTCNHSSGTE